MRDLINVRRLSRACTALVAASREPGSIPGRGDVQRVADNVAALKKLVDKLQRLELQGGPAAASLGEHALPGELVECANKARLLEAFVQEHRHLLDDDENDDYDGDVPVAFDEGAPPGQAPVTKAAEAKGAPHEEGLQEEVFPRESGKSGDGVVRADGATHEPEVGASEETRNRAALFGGARDDASAFASFMADSSHGAKAMAEQLEQQKQETKELTAALSTMVASLNQKAKGVSDRLQSDAKTVDEVNEHADKNLNYISSMSERLNITIKTSSMSCYTYTAGGFTVLALWVLAYLVMRLFPRVKT